MSDTYTKLFKSITASSVWGEPHSTRSVWTTLMAQSDAHGCVYASVPGLARFANATREETEAALACFLAPDPDSRTTDHEGRRIEVIDGGWRLLNHAKFSAMRSSEERAEYKRQWDRDHRPSGSRRGPTRSDNSPTQSDKHPTKTDSPTPPDPTPDLNGTTTLDRDTEVVVANGSGARSAAVQACIEMTKLKVKCTSQNPDLIAMLAEGGTVEELVAQAKENPGKPLRYLTNIVRRQIAEGATPIVPAIARSITTTDRSVPKSVQALQSLERIKQDAKRRMAAGSADERDTGTDLLELGGPASR